MLDQELKITPELQGFVYHTINHLHLDMENQKHNMVQEHIVTSGERPEGFTRFTAIIPVGFAMDGKGNKQKINGTVKIDAADPAEAFGMLEQCIEEQRPQIQQNVKNAIARSNIQIPGQALINRLNENGQDFSLGGN
ncbi:MAG: hypothetical protein V3S55_09570 [Nitrospiraceae bacterium]